MSEELSRSRAPCRGWVTRECKNWATTLEDPELNVVKLSAAMDEFEKRLTNLDDVQSRYELSLEDENAILNDITTAADFRDSARKVRTLATEKFKELSGDSDNKSAAHVLSFSITDVKLPKLNLPVFNGDVLQWQSFWDQFVAAVDSTDLPDVSKFSYLGASLEGESVMCHHRRRRHLVVMWMHPPHIRRQQHLSSVLQILHHLVTCPRHTHLLHCSLLVLQCMAVRVLPRPR